MASDVDPAACADAYRALRGRVTTLVRDTDPAALDAVAPATPEWRVRDVLALYDACTHEHDIRHALDAPGARDSDAVALSFWWATDMLGTGTAPHLVLHTDGEVKAVGSGEPRTTVRTSRFEVVRALTGRRSRAQIEAYEWDGEPRPDALVLGIFSRRADDLVE